MEEIHMKILVTGGAGFIGGNFVHHMVNKYPDYQIVNLDLLTYAGNLETLKPVRLTSLLIYIAVVSPSRLEFVAMITSSTSPWSRCINSLSLISFGPIPSIGEIAPWRTWYTPSYLLVFS